MRLITAIVCLVLLSGCSVSSYLDKIPNASFKKFEYHRGGNITSANIIATDAVASDGILLIDSININADYGPAVNFNIKLEGYERDSNAIQN